MDKYKNKYRIASARLQHWDYQWAGAYFITICTQHREHYFGRVVEGKMELSGVGVIADILWHQIPHHVQHVALGAFVVMPNHIHGVLIKTQNENGADSDNDGTDDIDDTVETLHATSLQSKISPKSNSISTIIRSYKSAVTKHANCLGYTFQWQPRFHDHIIRNDKSFQNISAYIMNNPANWQGDKFFNL